MKQGKDLRNSASFDGGAYEQASTDGAEVAPAPSVPSRKGDGYPTLAAAFLSLTSLITGGCSHPHDSAPRSGSSQEGERATSLEDTSFQEIVATKLGGASVGDQRLHGRGFITREGVAAARDLAPLFDPRELIFESPSVDGYLRRLGRMEEITRRLINAECSGIREILESNEANHLPTPVKRELQDRQRVMTEAAQRFTTQPEFLDMMVQETELRYEDFVTRLH
jgi:hypothetical protein